MSLPAGFIEELRTRVSITQVVGRKVIWDMRKSNQAKGDMWAPCPFHQEKSASFHVDDRKGYYYCFGCHTKGDAISFVQATENLSFMETVALLARDVGMPMPERDPQAAEKADRAQRLVAATEAAVSHFRLQLKTAAAAEARAYLDRRGLDSATIDQFEIGFAPNTRQGAFGALTAKGIPADDLIDAGLASRPDDGGPPYDAFRDRIMFPIRDTRGRCIGFGGRAMAPDARAKYLNSRETALFDKGRSLYNHGPAREAAGKGQPVIVAEGYMDVIALVRAGFAGAIAPLGTAVTEDQLRLIWRMAPEPIIALDGDAAGIRAAMRLVDLALPMLEPGKSLRFCILPEGQDPDDLLRARGAEAMRALLDGAEPLVRMLWRRETEGQVFDSPERRAALDQRLRQCVARIPDQNLRRHYGEALAELRRGLFRPPQQAAMGQTGRGGWRARGFAEAQNALAGTRNSALGSGSLGAEDLRVTLILATLCRYPALIAQFEGDLARLALRDPDHGALVDLLLATGASDAAGVASECSAAGLGPALDRLQAMPHLRITPILSGPPSPDKAAICLTEEFQKYHAARALAAEMTEALEDLENAPEGDKRLLRRLNHAVQTRHRAGRPAAPDATGAVNEDTTALSNGLQALIEARVWEKKSR
jgi:DNA primase